ncbi:MAG: acetolactate decarboxylase [Rhodanobacter thiooxydans]|nr:acetolactate decarboxylase [Rhodanobacter thiooxydans]
MTGVAAVAASLPFDFIHFGNFTRMVESGRSDGQVLLADLPQRQGDWGLGATAGLKGEIVQIDGRLLASPGSDAQRRVQVSRHYRR